MHRQRGGRVRGSRPRRSRKKATAGPDRLKLLIKEAARSATGLNGASATDLLCWTDETFGDGYVVAFPL